MLATNSTNATIKMKTLCVISAVCLLASLVSQAQGAVQPLTLDQEVTQTGRICCVGAVCCCTQQLTVPVPARAQLLLQTKSLSTLYVACLVLSPGLVA